MNEYKSNHTMSASAHGSAAKNSTNSNESKSSPRTPIPGTEEPVKNQAENVMKPNVIPFYDEDPRHYYFNKLGSPLFVNPAIFANPFQQSEFGFPQYPKWAMPNVLGHSPTPPITSGGRIPSQSSETVNENLATEKNFNQKTVAPTTMLNRITDSYEFSTWIKNFSIFLGEHLLDHIIPDENGKSTTPASDEEKKFVLDIFKFFVSPKAYPAWFSKKLQERFIELYDVIEHALYRENEYDNDRTIAKELFSIYYDGKSDPFFFQKKLENLRKKGLEVGITTTDTVLCDRIVEHLFGPFKSIADNYDRNYTTITLTDLLNEIQRVYNRHVKNRRKSTTVDTSVTVNNKPSIKSYTEKPTALKSAPRNVTKGKGKRLFHVQQLDPSSEALRPLEI